MQPPAEMYRTAVPEDDDDELPVSTWREWLVSMENTYMKSHRKELRQQEYKDTAKLWERELRELDNTDLLEYDKYTPDVSSTQNQQNNVAFDVRCSLLIFSASAAIAEESRASILDDEKPAPATPLSSKAKKKIILPTYLHPQAHLFINLLHHYSDPHRRYRHKTQPPSLYSIFCLLLLLLLLLLDLILEVA